MTSSNLVFVGDCNVGDAASFPANATSVSLVSTTGASLCTVDALVSIVGNTSLRALHMIGTSYDHSNAALQLHASAAGFFSSAGAFSGASQPFLENVTLNCSTMADDPTVAALAPPQLQVGGWVC
jgi:hypothetical protein